MRWKVTWSRVFGETNDLKKGDEKGKGYDNSGHEGHGCWPDTRETFKGT